MLVQETNLLYLYLLRNKTLLTTFQNYCEWHQFIEAESFSLNTELDSFKKTTYIEDFFMSQYFL